MNVSPSYRALFISAAITGCAGVTGDAGWPTPRPLGSELGTPRSPAATREESVEPPSGTEILTLTAVRRRALRLNPELVGRVATVRARQAEARQAAVMPNPEVEILAEDLVLAQQGVRTDAMQVTATVIQPVELGGRRAALVVAAAHRRDAAGWSFEQKRLEVFRDATKAFIDLLAAQRRHTNAAEMVGLAEATVQVLEAKAGAGQVTPLEVRRTKVTLALARIEQEKAARALDVARYAVAAYWGESPPTFGRGQGGFDIPERLPASAELHLALMSHPELQRQVATVEEYRARLDVERSKTVPDVDVGIGLRWLNATGESALVAGVTVPVPIFDTNQGQIDAASHEATRAEQDMEATRLDLARQLEQAMQSLRAAHYEVETLGREVLTEARESYDAVAAGYQLGRFGYLDLLDAQRTLFEAVQRAVEARATFFKAAADVEALAGTSLFDWTPAEEEEMSELNWRQGSTDEPVEEAPAAAPTEPEKEPTMTPVEETIGEPDPSMSRGSAKTAPENPER